MEKRLSGPQLFLRYAFPCVGDRLHAHLINRLNFELLKSLVKDGGEPRISLLRKCFPNAVKSLETFARIKKKKMWAIRTVAKFWRHHHGHEGDCAVRLLTVVAVDNVRLNASVEPGFTVKNFYALDLREGDKVFIHRRVVIEKAD